VARQGTSIGVRLALSFLVVFAVFSTALLLTLHHLDKVRKATETVERSQQTTRHVALLGRLAEDFFNQQRAFIYADDLDISRYDRCKALADEIDDTLHLLRDAAVGPLERKSLYDLSGAADGLIAIFLEDIIDVKWEALFQEIDPEESQQELELLLKESRQYLMAIEDLRSDFAARFAVRTGFAGARAAAAWQASVTVAQLIFPVALLVSFLAVYYTHRSVLRPVRTLIRATQALARGDFGSRMPLTGPTEFRELAAGFNSMAHALAAHQAQLLDSEKLASIGRIAAGIAHEINNPLTVILGHTNMLLATVAKDTPEREQLEAIAEEARLCRNIVSGLLDLSRPSDPTAGDVLNPREVAAEAFGMLGALGLTEGLETQLTVVDRDLPLAISRPRLRQLILNIARNGLEVLRDLRDGYMKLEGYVRPREKLTAEMLEEADEAPDAFLVLVFRDNGPGIPEPKLARLFEPFYTTKATGMGLGLAISYNIARSHGGFITVETAPAEGTTFTVGIPLTQPA